MCLKKYLVKYTDKFGSLKSEVISHGSNLRLELRNTIFEGREFESLETKETKGNFEFNSYNELTNFELEIEIPIIIGHLKNNFNGELILKLEKSIENKKDYGVELVIKEATFKTVFGENLFARNMYNFEYLMIDMQKTLPENYEIKTCISCKYSNYHPCGNSEFGDLVCFKNVKNKFEKIKDKSGLMNLWDEARENNQIFNVNEIYECADHEFIGENDWTYKDWDYVFKKLK